MRIVWMTLVLVALRFGSAWADPLVGTWKMTSQGKPGGVTAQTINITATADGHKWSYDITLGNNHVAFALVTNVKTGTVTMQTTDGKPLGSGHFKKTGDAAWELDTPKHKSSGSISADGKKMTINQTVPMQVTIVFDKQ
jgi:hypothetical protein